MAFGTAKTRESAPPFLGENRKSFARRTRSRKRPRRRETVDAHGKLLVRVAAQKERFRAAAYRDGTDRPARTEPRATGRATGRANLLPLACSTRPRDALERRAHSNPLPRARWRPGFPETSGRPTTRPRLHRAGRRSPRAVTSASARARARRGRARPPHALALARPRGRGSRHHRPRGARPVPLAPARGVPEGPRGGGAVAPRPRRREDPVDARDPGGRTPLHFAAGWGRMEIVRLLLERGAALEPRDAWGKAPVDWARQADQKDAELRDAQGGEEHREPGDERREQGAHRGRGSFASAGQGATGTAGTALVHGRRAVLGGDRALEPRLRRGDSRE